MDSTHFWQRSRGSAQTSWLHKGADGLSCSPRTRRGAWRRTSPSCRSCCGGTLEASECRQTATGPPLSVAVGGFCRRPPCDLSIGRPLAPMRRAHVNYATGPYFDPATVTEATGELNSVLAVMIYHRHHQVAVFRDRIKRANEAPHAIFLQLFADSGSGRRWSSGGGATRDISNFARQRNPQGPDAQCHPRHRVPCAALAAERQRIKPRLQAGKTKNIVNSGVTRWPRTFRRSSAVFLCK